MSTDESVGFPLNPQGGNNAIYCYLYVAGVRVAFRVGIFEFFDRAQNKNKAGFAIWRDGEPQPNVQGLKTNGKASTNLYWQVENENGKDICTIGESLSSATNTSANVLRQATNANLPSQ